jgi:aryl-alcohol dehydrogenase-like predicted oxidoreductase
MTLRPFGTSGLQVSPISFGAMRIVGDRPDGASSALLAALERGITAIDTARNYGESEAIVARTLRAWHGARPLIATKVKPRDISNWRHYVPMDVQFTSRSIEASVEESLRTLGVDCLDLVQLHQWYYRWSHETTWLEALHALRAAGKIRYIGVSAQDHEHDGVLKLVDDRLVDGVQVVFNAFESRPLVSVVPLAAARGVGVIARCVFDHSGALAGVATRESLARDVKLANASPELVTEYLRRIDRLHDDARAHGMDLVELSVRFALTHPGMSTLAISLADVAQVEAAIAAADKGPLPEVLFERIRREHVWVKNFYYFSTATVDGNRAV